MNFRFLNLALATMFAWGLLSLAATSVLAQAGQMSAEDAAALKTASEKPTPRTAEGQPNLVGYWENFPKANTSQNGTVGADGITYSPFVRPPGSGRAAIAAGPRPTPNEPSYKPEFVAKVKELAAHAEDKDTKDPSFFCKPLGVPRIGHPRQIIQTPGLIVFLYQVDSGEGAASGNAVRLIPTDGRPHRKDVDPMYFGDSIGHWEGDTLVVDVTHLAEDTWLDGRGSFHTDALHVVERITRTGDTLRWEATADDPNVLTGPWTVTPQTAMLTHDMVVEQPPCEERDQTSGELGAEEHK